jgi:hypothetical protein
MLFNLNLIIGSNLFYKESHALFTVIPVWVFSEGIFPDIART